MQNEGPHVSKSGRGHVWHGNEEEEEVGITHSEPQTSGKEGKGINWRCSLNTNVAGPPQVESSPSVGGFEAP